MAIFKFANCKRLPAGKPPFSYGFPMVFLWFSYGFPMKSLQKTHQPHHHPTANEKSATQRATLFCSSCIFCSTSKTCGSTSHLPTGGFLHLKMWRNTIQLAMSTGEKRESMMINYGILGCKTRNCRTYPSFLGD